MASFENRRPYPGDNLSGKVTAARSRGTPMGAGATAGEFDLASGTNFLGFLRQQVTVAGPTLADHVFASGRGELVAKVNDQVGLELSDEADVADEFLLLSGTGSLAANTAVGTLLSFVSGKFRVKQSSDHAFYQLSEQLTADSDNSETVRIRVNRI